jgi:hypothetical protein
MNEYRSAIYITLVSGALKSYQEVSSLPSSVFTHADITPPKIMVDKRYRRTGSLIGRQPGDILTIGSTQTLWALRAGAETGKNGWTVLHRINLRPACKA